MTNCLVTKLKGSVNNDNLPIFGKFKLLIEHVDNANNDDKWFVLLAGSSQCKITFVNTNLIDGSFAGKTEVTLTANTKIASHIDLSGNNISIIVDAYSVVGFQQLHCTDIVGYESLKYGEFINGNYADNPSGVKEKIAEVLNTKTGIKYLSNLPVSDETIVRNAGTLVACYKPINPAIVKDSTILLVCSVNAGYNIEYVPATVKIIDLRDTAIGSITTLVNKFRAAGRTSGKIYVGWLTANIGCTIDNGSGTEIPVSEYVTAHGLPIQPASYLYWTADTVGITVDKTNTETCPSIWFEAPYV